MESEQFKSYVNHIVYRNDSNGYTVFEVVVDGEVLTCTGMIPAMNEGESCALTGEYTTHPVYGRQFKVSTYQVCAPEDSQALLRYLGSGAIKGIGEQLATRIIRAFGEDTLRIMEEEPERLAEVKGISERKAREIAAQMEDKKDLREAMMFLQQFGISNHYAIKIWQNYGMAVYQILKENPYKLAEDIQGIGFATADQIAVKAGIRADSDFRIRSGLLFIVSSAMAEGSSYLPKPIVIAKTAELLELPVDNIEIQLDNLAVERKLILKCKGEEVQVYSAASFREEGSIARMLCELAAVSQPYDRTEKECHKKLEEIEQAEGFSLDELQRHAIYLAITRSVLLLSGGPGTGKTTTISTMISYFITQNMDVLLAAPTGRAAKRMTEATGYTAMTIHRLLGVKAMENGGEQTGQLSVFERGLDNPLEADAVIIDEMSMVDMHLFSSLLKAIAPGTRLIMVGDVNQLPSVGPGKILQDLISSKAFETVILTKIFRQAATSDIVMNAHRIHEGKPMVLDNQSKDFFFLERSDPQVIYKHMIQLMTQMLPKYVSCDTMDIQVLTPMRKGPLGVERLNQVLQSMLNPEASGKREIKKGDIIFREGDKVMQIKNDYQLEWEVLGNYGIPIDKGLGVFNGDFGMIKEIDSRGENLTVQFDEFRLVKYQFMQLEELELAYAVTVHKSQGSEYPAVILPLLSGPRSLFNRNLLYTAVTRAKACVTILGSRSLVEAMAENTSSYARYTGLEDRIHELTMG